MAHITLAQAKLYCRVSHDGEDDLFSDTLIPAALAWLEDYTGRVIDVVSVTDSFQDTEVEGLKLTLRRQPVDVASVVVEIDGDVVDPSGYTVEVDLEGVGTIEFDEGYSYSADDAIEVTYDAGYADGDLPKPLLQAALAHIDFVYENRAQGGQPEVAKLLANPYRTRLFAGG